MIGKVHLKLTAIFLTSIKKARLTMSRVSRTAMTTDVAWREMVCI
jgi:hypothetical protein